MALLTNYNSQQTNRQDKIKFMASGKEYEVVEVGFMTPEKKTVDVLRAGEVRGSLGQRVIQ